MKIIGKINPILLYFLASLSSLSETIYATALPSIADNLNTSGGTAQLSSTAYYIGFAIGILTLGSISDIYGRRPTAIFGISFYLISTIIISFSPNIEFFIFWRFMQAYGASVGSVVGQAITRDSFKGWELSYVYASISMVMAVIPSIGAIAGGYIIGYSENWRFIFLFLSILSLLALLIYLKYLPETNPYTERTAENRFTVVLRSAVKDSKLLSSAYIVGAFNGICFGFFIQAPFIFIDRLNMNPINYGKLFWILSISSLIGSLLSIHLIKNYYKPMNIKNLGFILSAIGCSLMLLAVIFMPEVNSIKSGVIFIFFPLAIHLMGHAMIIPMILRSVLVDYSKVKGMAGSIFGCLYYTFTALICLMISKFHSDSINNFLTIYLVLLITSFICFLRIKKN